jgi:hypothetical protein
VLNSGTPGCSVEAEWIYDDALGETKGLIQWVGERWVSWLMVIRQDLVSWKLSGCECTSFMPNEQERGLFA